MARGHHMKRGGMIPEEKEGKMHDYTADSEVTKEAMEKKDGGRMKKADGGRTAFARGGGVKKHVMGEGHKGSRRLDRPGRKRGGGVGADMRPLTTAAKTTEAGAHKADNDELAC